MNWNYEEGTPAFEINLFLGGSLIIFWTLEAWKYPYFSSTARSLIDGVNPWEISIVSPA
jgi:hypothetical protein